MMFPGTNVMNGSRPGETDSWPLLLCAWCNNVIREGSLPASHGICDRCSRQVQAELQRRPIARTPASGLV